jgi:dienelactone hydrolase
VTLRRAGTLVSALIALSAAAADPKGADPKAPDPIAAEAKRRSDALVQDGFNMTHGWTFKAVGEAAPLLFEFLLPKGSDEHRISFWMETKEGEASVRLVGPNSLSLFAWSGRRGEVEIARALPAGTYVLEIDASKSTGGRALFGVKGFLVHRCEMNAARTFERPAAPARGFHWPYFLYVPTEARAGHLLVAPNNTGFGTDDPGTIGAASSCEVRRQAPLADKLGAPLLVPLFPRPPAVGDDDNLYLHALTRAALKTDVPAFRRVDIQLLAMAEDARTFLAAKGIAVDTRLLLRGFSASGSFVNRFAVLHPENALAVACGSPGGWPIAPSGREGEDALPYPVGTGDLAALAGKSVDARVLRSVAWFFFLGDRDANDAVVFRDSFSKADEELVFRLYGPTPVSRWKKAERLYAKAGLDARFVLYPGAGHEVTREMDADVAKFFEERLARGSPPARN